MGPERDTVMSDSDESIMLQVEPDSGIQTQPPTPSPVGLSSSSPLLVLTLPISAGPPSWEEPMTLELTVANLQAVVSRILSNEEEELVESPKKVGVDLAWYFVTMSPSEREDGTKILYCAFNVENTSTRNVDTRARVDVISIIKLDNGEVKTEEHQKEDWIEVFAHADSTESMADFTVLLEPNMVEFTMKVVVRFQEPTVPVPDATKKVFRNDELLSMKRDMTKFAEAIQQLVKFGIYTPENEDFKVQCSTGQVIGFHKDLLKARGGNVLRKELYKKMDQSVVFMRAPEFSLDIWVGFKSYIYYGGIADLLDRVDDYYEFAAHYEVEELKDLTEIVMVQHLSEYTFRKYHRIAANAKYNTKYLKEKMKKFIYTKQKRMLSWIDFTFEGCNTFWY